MWGFPSDDQVVQSILSETPMQPMFWCRVKIHKWTRWEITAKGRAKSHGDYTNVEYEEVRRECRCCGVPQKKVVWCKVK